MKIYFLTLALDPAPWIYLHLHMFSKLKLDWEWHIVEGVAEPVKDTAWCKPMTPRFSTDGTHEFLSELSQTHPRVFHYARTSWPGKTAMLNHATENFKEPGLIWQLDSDEAWDAHQVEVVEMMFRTNPKRDAAYFKCDYWLGADIKVVSRGTYGDNSYEWLRVFRFSPGMQWLCHEPPVLHTKDIRPFTKEQTEAMNLIFQHFSYSTAKQVSFKQAFYGYENALSQWQALQRNTEWPCPANRFLKWIPEGCICDKVHQ